MRYRIIHADVMDGLRQLPGSSFDACFCDPPYGLSSTEKRSPRRATPRASSRAKAAGFMGMEWDATVPGVAVWSEVLRVLRPGAPLLAFGGTRTFHRLAVAIEDAGFSLSDTLCWLYGQGFPKGKAQLKPAWEPITLAWKAGKRRLAIDAGRIPVSDQAYRKNCSGDRGQAGTREKRVVFRMGGGSANDAGRWPANVILDEEAAAALDAQTGILASGTMLAGTRRNNRMGYSGAMPPNTAAADTYGDTGGASRFFYVAKADSAERHSAGTNNHPTVKPLELTSYLAKLLKPPAIDARMLVPFSGSGSEIMGALRAGWAEAVGIELNLEYVEMARRRISNDAPLLNVEAVHV